jgi:hypothetical protein
MPLPVTIAVPTSPSDPQQARQFAIGVKKGMDYLSLGILNLSTGAPSDTPAIGTTRYQVSTKKIWVHEGAGTWRYVVLT